jgi:hypothetical protein
VTLMMLVEDLHSFLPLLATSRRESPVYAAKVSCHSGDLASYNYLTTFMQS